MATEHTEPQARLKAVSRLLFAGTTELLAIAAQHPGSRTRDVADATDFAAAAARRLDPDISHELDGSSEPSVLIWRLGCLAHGYAPEGVDGEQLLKALNTRAVRDVIAHACAAGHPRPLTLERVSAAINTAADRVLAAIDAPATGVRDAINLLVNYACALMEDPDRSLADVIVDCYQESASEVLSWARDEQ